MLPGVIIYDVVSLDGRIEGFEPDVGAFYTLARDIAEDVILAGADTMLAGGDAVPADDLASPPAEPSGGSAPLLAIVDSRGRVRSWDWLREQQYWRDAVALVSDATPADYLAHLDSRRVARFACGADRVDLRAALTWLVDEHGVRTVRVESGGALNGALLRAGLATEVHLLVQPCLAGEAQRSFVRGALSAPVALELIACDARDDGLVHVRYRVADT